MYDNVKQSYAEQQNPPTETLEATNAATVNVEAEAQAMWACVASEVGYGDYDTETSLVDKITDIETAITGKAAASHAHPATDISGLATVATSGNYNDLTNKPTAYTHPASHPASMISGLADVATSGSYNDLTNKPTIPTVPASLPANGGNADTVDNKHASDFATASHTHTQYAGTTHGHAVSEITGLSDELNGKADADHTHSGYAASAHTHAASAVTGLAAVATTGSYNDLTDKPDTTTPAAHTHAQSDVTGLTAALSGKANTSHTHAQTDITGLEAALVGKADVSHTHDYAASSHTHAQSDVTGLATALSGKANTSHTHGQSEITGLADALAGKADASHSHTGYAASGHTHTEYAAASHTHSGYAASNHNHDSAYVPFDLFGFNTQGGVEYSYGSGSGKNVLTEISNMPQGVHTIYAIAGTTGNPETTESYRYFIHKTSGTIGWIWAFGADGSVYSNYQSAAGTFKGWRTIHDTKRKPLWTGSYYMTAGHTATPSKKLSQCEHGWMLLWSDYDPDTGTVNNSDFATTMIPNRSWAGATWNGAAFYCDVPRYSAGTATDSESRIIKVVNVYDNKIVGSDNNNAAPRNDVILRAIYEF